MDFSSRVAPLKRGYAGLFTSIPEAFVQGRASAPNYEVNTDDYDSEVATIIRRLSSARSAEEVERPERTFALVGGHRRIDGQSCSRRSWMPWCECSPVGH
jgi:hypothetical protein